MLAGIGYVSVLFALKLMEGQRQWSGMVLNSLKAVHYLLGFVAFVVSPLAIVLLLGDGMTDRGAITFVWGAPLVLFVFGLAFKRADLFSLETQLNSKDQDN